MHCGHAAGGGIRNGYLPRFSVPHIAGHSVSEALAAEVLGDIEFKALNSGRVLVIEIGVVDEVVKATCRARADWKLFPPHGVRVRGAAANKELGSTAVHRG